MAITKSYPAWLVNMTASSFLEPPILTMGNFSRGLYWFTADLLALESASPTRPSTPYDATLASPLKPQAWERALVSIPDRPFTDFLVRGLSFRIGVAQGAPLRPARRNLRSAYEHPDVVTAYLQREVELCHLSLLPDQSSLGPPLVQISPFGVIPKKARNGA